MAQQTGCTERRELRQAIVERVPMTDDLTDDDFAALAAASFRVLDEEEGAREHPVRSGFLLGGGGSAQAFAWSVARQPCLRR
jgi:hypothetical protein